LQKIISDQAINTADFENLNHSLYKAERLLISSKGLPRRPWFKNQIYAPGFYTGYGVKTLPGVREAIEQKNWIEVQEQIGILSETLNNFSDYLDKIAVLKN
ncbi:MAG: folate hydrolase, partial [Flavobacteriales bacterium CG03_land_8_20_14_0_80_35_15]